MLRCASCHRLLTGARCPRDGWTQPAARIDGIDGGDTPPRVEGLALQERLGTGGFSIVWAATREDGSAATVKVGRGDAPVLVERFRREAEAMAIIGSPYAARLYAQGRLRGGQPYIVMERLYGQTLGQLLAALAEPLELARLARLAGGVLSALEAVHARGVVHRDLKPENVFLAGGGERVVLLDFGLAKRPDAGAEELTRSGVAVGTPEYMAPEQLRGDRGTGAPADIYAFGVMLYELLTLRLPFVGELSEIEHGHLALRPPRPSEISPAAAPLDALVLACLSKEPERRPRGAAALRAALEEASVTPAPVSQPPASRGPRTSRMIAEGKQPVVLAAIESDGDADALSAAVSERGGFIARQRGRRYLAVFSGLHCEDPARAALAAARALAELQGARTALHLSSATLRSREGQPPMAFGVALDRPEAWLPQEPWSGVTLTEEIARALPDEEAQDGAARSGASGEAGSGSGIDVSLIGRDAVFDALAGSARAALDDGEPALFTLLGEQGLGKTRLAAEAALLASRVRPGVKVIPLSARATDTDGGRALTEALSGALEPDTTMASTAASHHERVRALADALRRRARLGPVAVILDDAHWAEVALIDALELATLEGSGCPLWVVVTAHPRFEQVRPGWGARTRRRERAALEPLPAEASMRLAAELLRPAEYPPAAVLERLAVWSGGNPASLGEIVRALKRAGVVRRRNESTSYVATADIEALPPSPAWQWLASRRLGALSPELAACVRLCSVLGAAFGREELEWVQDAIERAGAAGTPVDVAYGLRVLTSERVLVLGGDGRYAFESALYQDAVYELLDPAQRAVVHGHALEHWRARILAAGEGPETLEAIARHAAAVGRVEEAADALLRLGDRAFERHRHVEADRRYTGALELLPAEDARRRMAALLGRGRCRYRVSRENEAVEDLAEARRLAEALGDQAMLAEASLEEATALDWMREFDASARRVEEAAPIVRELGSLRLEVRLAVAQGRTLWRSFRRPESIRVLERAVVDAVGAGDYEARVIGLLILAFQLAREGRLDEAERRFEEVIHATKSAGDYPHLLSAYVNRTVLWFARGDAASALRDLRVAAELARESGSPLLERLATSNAAELLLRLDQGEEALALVRRARLLEERFLEAPEARGSLLHARILLTLGRYQEAAEVVLRLQASGARDLSEGHEPKDMLGAMFCMLRLALRDLAPEQAELRGEESWGGLLRAAEGFSEAYVLLEILYWRARVALRAGRQEEALEALARAKGLCQESPVWAARFEALAGAQGPPSAQSGAG